MQSHQHKTIKCFKLKFKHTFPQQLLLQPLLKRFDNSTLHLGMSGF